MVADEELLATLEAIEELVLLEAVDIDEAELFVVALDLLEASIDEVGLLLLEASIDEAELLLLETGWELRLDEIVEETTMLEELEEDEVLELTTVVEAAWLDRGAWELGVLLLPPPLPEPPPQAVSPIDNAKTVTSFFD